ncbi:DNA methyltransferase [Helicobacter suis]|nr:DNA methyltransferase [Helicobacter suis]
MLFDTSKTLPQLVYLKEHLNISRSKVDNFIMALLTGIMHGKQAKSGSSIYCSIDMPNTFSFSPAYIKKYIAKHHLKAPCQDVFMLLEQRLNHLFSQPVTPFQCLSKYTSGYCFQTDAIKCSQRMLQKFGKNSVALIVTSPPYLKNISYAKFNWIRLWLFKKSQNTQEFRDDNLAFKPYATYLHKLFNSWVEILKPGGRACVVIGDVHDRQLALDVWEFCKGSSGLKLETILVDDIKFSPKTTRIWGNKKGRATKIDRILVLQKE